MTGANLQGTVEGAGARSDGFTDACEATRDGDHAKPTPAPAMIWTLPQRPVAVLKLKV